MAFITRIDDPDLLTHVDQLAEEYKMSRNMLIQILLEEAVQDGFIPRQVGEGFAVITPSGGQFTLSRAQVHVYTTASDLSRSENDIFKTVRTLAGQGHWRQVKKVLTTAGFKIHPITL